jgi:chaperonin GroEL
MPTRDQLISDNDSRESLLRGIDSLADALKVTLGPQSANLKLHLSSTETTTKENNLAPPMATAEIMEQIGVRAMHRVLSKTAEGAGDGKVTAALLTQAIIRDGTELVRSGADPVSLKRGIEKAIDVVVKNLQDAAKPLFRGDIFDAAKKATLPDLAQILKDHGLNSEQTDNFLTENERLKLKSDLSVVPRLLRAGQAADLDMNITSQIAASVLDAQEKLNSVYQSLMQPIKQFASDSANGDEEIGTLIADAIGKAGKHAVITIGASKSDNTSIEFVNGFHFDQGYLSPYFVTDPNSMQAVLENPVILIHEKKMSSMRDFLPLLEQVAKLDRPMLVIAEDVEGEALATLVVNKLRGSLQIVAVKAPGVGERKRAILEDIAIFAAGRLISEDGGLRLEDAGFEELGQAMKVIVNSETTQIVGGNGTRPEIDRRIAALRGELTGTDSDYEREKTLERVARLQQTVAMISIGASESDISGKIDRATRAANATVSAVEEGVVPGGGVALLRSITKLDELELDEQEILGVEIVKRALEAPIRQIAENVGRDAGDIIARIRASDDQQFGFNAQSGTFSDLVAAGIIDPAKVTRTALQNAGSAATSILSKDMVELDEDIGIDNVVDISISV